MALVLPLSGCPAAEPETSAAAPRDATAPTEDTPRPVALSAAPIEPERPAATSPPPPPPPVIETLAKTSESQDEPEPATQPTTQSISIDYEIPIRADDPPTPPIPAIIPTPTATPPESVTVDPTEALLDRLETSAADLRGFTANVYYEIFNDLLARREIRLGELIYAVDPATGTKRFAVLFDALIVNNRRTDRLKHFVFDGQWLAEIDEEQKTFTKQQIVPPGRHLDPLKLGEGPFPLPVGQPKEEVLARFDVSPLNALPEGPLSALVEKFELDGLLLIPKPGTEEAKDDERVEIFYDRSTLLPVGIRLLQTNGNIKTVRLSDPVRNPVLTPEELAKLSIEDPDPREWTVSTRAWQGP